MFLNLQQIADRIGLTLGQVRKQIHSEQLILGPNVVPLTRIGGKRGRLFAKAVDLDWIDEPSVIVPPSPSHNTHTPKGNPKPLPPAVAEYMRRMNS